MLEKFKDKKIAILGFGIEGKETYRYLVAKGFCPTIIDQKSKDELVRSNPDLDLKVTEVLGGPNYLDCLKNFDLIFKTPGIKNTKEVEEAQNKGTVFSSQIELFFDNCPCRTIGITGTKGKGTTSTLIYEMLKNEGRDVYLGGNIGIPALSFLDKLKEDSIAVLELSSFQLQNLTVSPNIAVVLNITSEHLDYHKDTDEYRDAKKNIVKFQHVEDCAVFNADYEVPVAFSNETKAQKYFVSKEKETNGCFVNENDEVILAKTGEIIVRADELLLRGRHNLENVTAAAMVASLAGVSIETIRKTLITFKGLEHRLELVREVRGVRYYNDSFSTVPETAIAAIKAFAEPKVIILGGSYKGSDYSELGEEIVGSNVMAVILIGEMAEQIEASMGDDFTGEKIKGLTKMEDIVAAASKVAKDGDVVLLSPACASFGLFENYKDRGNQFKEAVQKL